MDCNGKDEKQLINLCKVYCLGYLYGSQSEEIVNDAKDFEIKL